MLRIFGSAFRIPTHKQAANFTTAPSIRYSKIASAEGEGFEPSMPFRTFRFSRPVQSTSLPPLLFYLILL